MFEHPARGYKLHEFENSRHGREAPSRGINARQSEGPNATDVSVVVWRRPHDARFLCTLKGIKFSKENEYTYQKLAEPIISDLAQGTRN